MAMTKPAKQMQSVKFSEYAEKLEAGDKIITGLDVAQMQTAVAGMQVDIQALKEKGAFLQTEHQPGDFNDDIQDMIDGGYAGLIDFDGYVYFITKKTQNAIYLLCYGYPKIYWEEYLFDDGSWSLEDYGEHPSSTLLKLPDYEPEQIPSSYIEDIVKMPFSGFVDANTYVWIVIYVSDIAIKFARIDDTSIIGLSYYYDDNDEMWVYDDTWYILNIDTGLGTKLFKHTLSFNFDSVAKGNLVDDPYSSYFIIITTGAFNVPFTLQD